jgi:beta-lactam-binding protein with PASTA domain
LQGIFGHVSVDMDESEITQEHEPVRADTQAHEPVVAPPPAEPPRAPAPPPARPGPLEPGPPGVPPRLYADAWPWLALLGILAVAGLLVWLFAFRGNDKGTIVPGVVGLQQQQAIAKLTGDGFGVRAIIGPSKRPRGIVVSQKPGGGSRLDKGQNVVINISNGLAAAAPTTSTQQTTTQQTTTTDQQTTTGAAASATVPDVTGQAASDGAGQVEAAGFVAETEPVAEAGTAGSIVAQDPGGSGQAPAGSVVHLSVATGSNRPSRQIPDVTGQKAAAARAALLDAQLTVKTQYRGGPAKSAGTVLSQSPAAGSSQPAWSQITIVVGG